MIEKLKTTHFAWISLAVAVITMGLKLLAYYKTGSMGLLSDALESLVNVIGAVLALWMLSVAARPPDEEHSYGHSKAEYFSCGAEGSLILYAAFNIAWEAVHRILHPQPLAEIGLGLIVSGLATALNLGTALLMIYAGKRHHSISLKANGQHLLTDVWTSVGVMIGIALVWVTDALWLDPAIALLVALNITWTGYGLIREAIDGLMDVALPEDERQKIREILDGYEVQGVHYHAFRTRKAGASRFVSVHILVPGEWTVHRGHQILEELEGRIRATFPQTRVFTHLESLDDQASFEDMDLHRG